jgi:hypothetical protein
MVGNHPTHAFGLTTEVAVLSSHETIQRLAERIDRAYRRRHPRWRPVGLTPGVWQSAASRLLESSEEDPNFPVDPELFVAAQASVHLRRDPWAELTQSRSLRRYLTLIRRMIRQLRKELGGELRLTKRKLARGATLEHLLADPSVEISPLTRYILALRAGREDLAARVRPAAEDQHRSCPLYRFASRAMLPAENYPYPSSESVASVGRVDRLSFSLN